MLRRVNRGLQRAAGVRVCAHVNAPPHAFTREEAHHARLRRVRAVLRWFESVYTIGKPTTPASRPSPTLHGRAPTCKPRPPTSSRRSSVRTRERATARSLSRGRRRATRACGVCVPRRASWSRFIPYETPLRQRDGPLPRCTAVLRRASRGLQRAAGVRVCAHANVPPNALSREEAQHARMRRARAAPRWLEFVPALWKPTAPRRRPFLSVHGRAPTCQPRPPTSSRR